MIGLVWEWCSDFYASDYYASCASGVDDPQGPIGGGAHVQRGGSFGNRAVMCRPAVRTSPRTDARLKYHGFRVVREPDAVVAHEVHKKASATPGPTVPSVPPARPARPVAPPPIIRPQKPSSWFLMQANNKVLFRNEFIAIGILLVLSILILSVAKDGSFFVGLGGLGMCSSVAYLLTRGPWCLYVNWKNRYGSRK